MIHDLSDVIAQQWDTINGAVGKLDRLDARLQADQDHDVPAEEPPPTHYSGSRNGSRAMSEIVAF